MAKYRESEIKNSSTETQPKRHLTQTNRNCKRHQVWFDKDSLGSVGLEKMCRSFSLTLIQNNVNYFFKAEIHDRHLKLQ